MTSRFAVLGHPVAHSLSPRIHAELYAREKIDAVYERADVPTEALPAFLDRLAQGGYRGLSVTYPHKEAMFRATHDHDTVAQVCGAVNTLVRAGDGPPFAYRGANTDGEGFALFLERELGVQVGGLRVLMLGAGGSARSVLWALARRGPRALAVANRSAGRFADPFFERLRAVSPALELVAAAPDAPQVRALLDRADLVVHATPVGLGADAAPVPWPVGHLRDALIVDLNYRAGGLTPFLAGLPENTRAYDGRGMLLYQAAVAFELWFGRFPDTRGMLALLSKP